MILRPTSIGSKIMCSMVLVILLTGIVTIAIIQSAFKQHLALALKEKGLPIARSLAVTVVDPILVNDLPYLGQLLEEEKQATRDLSYAFIADKDDNVLAHTFSGGFPLQLLWVNKIVSGNKISIKLLDTEEGYIYDFAALILVNDTMLGTVRIGLSQKGIKTALNRITLISTVAILAVLVIGVGMTVALTRVIVKPIRSFQHSTEIIDGGDLGHRIVIETGDEIEQLAKSFNKMVTGLHKHDMALRKSEDNLKRAQSVAHIGSWSLDLSNNVLLWSDETHRIFGIPKGTPLTYEKFLEIVCEEDREYVDKGWAAALKGEPYDIEHRIMVGGKLKWINEKGDIEFDEQGKAVRAIGTAQDVTRRKLAEEALHKAYGELEIKVEERTRELSEANVRLKDLDRLKSMFIASMSHELRTPLNSIIGFTGIILQGMSGEINEIQRDQLNRVYHSAKHLLDLITDVIDISKIEAGRIDVFPEHILLTEIVDEAISSIQFQLKTKKLNIEVTVPEKLTLNTDRKRLLQCIINYLSNAVKFTEQGGIKVIAQEIDEDIKITVSDTGIGIAKEDIPKLFEAFERLETHLRVKAGGTGLGLYLTKKLTTELLCGSILVESELGLGSTFGIRIPKDLTLMSTMLQHEA